jgi:hypothetical protein
MSTGALLFAQNNASIDYIKLAVFAATKISKYLSIPVSLVTDGSTWLEQAYPDHIFDNIIKLTEPSSAQQKTFHDGSISSYTLDWKNLARSQSYDLTPYDTTLVLDSDYILNSPVLKPALSNDYDFQIYKNSFDLASWRPTAEFNRINQYSIPFYWATAFVFRKNSITNAFFDLVTYIKANWVYFRILYNIDASTFRNDFAFSIAIHIMNGKTNGEFAVELPGVMTYTTDKDLLVSYEDTKMKFLLERENHLGEYTLAKTTGLDVHVMNKASLSRFIDGESDV